MTLSVYGRQFTDVPAGETVTLTSLVATPPVYVGATVDGKSISGVTMTLTSVVFNILYSTTFTLTGQYSYDLATNDEYTAINTKNYISSTDDFEQINYTSYDTLIAEKGKKWDQLIKFFPDPAPEKTVTFTFTGGTPTTFTQKVHLIPTRHFTRLQNIIQSIVPDRTVVDSTGSIITPGYSSDPSGWT